MKLTWLYKHNVRSSVESISELNTLLQAREVFAETSTDTLDESDIAPFIDVLIISHEFTDHCHEATLREVSSLVPVFATSKAAVLIKSWKHFQHVYDMAIFRSKTDWRTTSCAPLPSWLGIARLVTPGDSLYYREF